MDNFDICQQQYDSMEHPDFYSQPKKCKRYPAGCETCIGDDCPLEVENE